ncbi:MAG TPA: hypothetical protein VLT61_09260, partial [Anaeromyxobacteraceae bacterium]|nr:hypothetical protein [Anaeromyxobacteraceae bacterium]
MKEVRVGDILVEKGIASRELVEVALKEARARSEHLCTRLLAHGVDERALAAALSEKLGVPGLDLSRSVIDARLVDLVPQRVAETDLILPVSSEGGRLHLAMAQPTDERILAEFRFVTGQEVSPWIAVTGALRGTIARAYAARQKGERLVPGPLAAAKDAPFLAAATPDRDAEDVVSLSDEDVEEVEAELLEEPAEEEVTVQVEPDADEPPPSAEEVTAVRRVQRAGAPPKPAAAKPAAGGEPRGAGGKRRILVVDDEPE